MLRTLAVSLFALTAFAFGCSSDKPDRNHNVHGTPRYDNHEQHRAGDDYWNDRREYNDQKKYDDRKQNDGRYQNQNDRRYNDRD